jgi:hypothetical protein
MGQVLGCPLLSFLFSSLPAIVDSNSFEGPVARSEEKRSFTTRFLGYKTFDAQAMTIHQRYHIFTRQVDRVRRKWLDTSDMITS